MMTENDRVRDVYRNPIGRDIICKLLLQMNISRKVIDNPIIGSLPLKILPVLFKKTLEDDFLRTFLELLNTEQGEGVLGEEPGEKAWWREAVIYQIYPRSFNDSNGDGIGDIPGILEKLDYLRELGVDAIWLSPVYDSPNDDNGYDIRDYRKILAEFGTMADFDRLLEGTHDRGMRLIMDLVVNHTSDEHEWFKKALEEPDSAYGDYYFFREKPNNWVSFFSGSAWKYFEERGQYGLHLFSEKQMDLNWDNPRVRSEIHKMVRWWLEKGVDGFRLDVINYISKREGLPGGNPKIGEMVGYRGVEHYFYGPRLHEYLKELRREAFEPYKAFSVGETPGIGFEMGKLLTSQKRGELDMVFSFDHLETPGHVRFDDYKYDLNYLKKWMMEYMAAYGEDCQAALFLENHDNPRMISKVGADPGFRVPMAKMLAVMILTLKGTPFIFQGQELGLVNKDFKSMEELRDVESLRLYEELCEAGASPRQAFQKVLAGTRDHARTPMPWSGDLYGGFSTRKPWIAVTDDYETYNAKAEMEDPNSVFSFYRQLIAFRKAHPVISYGNIAFVNEKKRNLLTYYRRDEREEIYVEINLGDTPMRAGTPKYQNCLLSSYGEKAETLRPFEARIYMNERTAFDVPHA